MPRFLPLLVAPTLRLAALVAAVSVSGCALLGGAPRMAAGPASPYPVAEADSLLARPELQRVVDLQVRRDGGALVRLLADPSRAVRARAALALGSVQDSAAVPALLIALGDDAPAVRANAAFAVGQSADSTAAAALLAALRTEATAAVKAEIVDAIGKVGGGANGDALLGVPLPPEVEPVRAFAVARMATRGALSPAGWQWLAGRLSAPAPVAEGAAYAFARSPHARWSAHAAAVRQAFDGRVGRDGDALVAMHVARALGRLADPTDAPRLITALARADDWRVRQAAAGALGAPAFAGGTVARAALWNALPDEQALVAQTAAEALARGDGAPSASDATAALIAVRYPRGRWTVQAALLPLLARAGRTDAVAGWSARQMDPFARAAALAALGSARDDASLATLLTASGAADARLAGAAVEALRARFAAEPDRVAAAPRYYPAFSAALTRLDLATTTAAAPALADSVFAPLGGPALLRDTFGRLDAPADIEPMVEIVRAIGKTRDGEEVTFLVGVALDGHPATRAAARDALNERLIDGIDVSIPPDAARTTPATTSIDWTHLARVGPRPRLVLETSRGRVVVEMDTEGAPQTVQLLTTTASGGRYDGVPFHRVVPNFVAQGGDFYRRDGYGGPETPIRSEFSRARYRTGTVGIASSGKDTEGVQFFVTHSPQPHLDGAYTVVGRVVEGQDVVDRLVVGDIVRRARVVPDRRR